MSLTLYYHPLSSYCWKVLTALYENGTAFAPRLVNLGDAADRAAFLALWPIGKFPVLRDETRAAAPCQIDHHHRVPGQHYPGPTRLVPGDLEQARETRARDRFFDLHVHDPMQRIVGDRLRPADRKDPLGVERARAALAYRLGDGRAGDGHAGPGRPGRRSRWRTVRQHRRSTMRTCLRFKATHPRTAAY